LQSQKHVFFSIQVACVGYEWKVIIENQFGFPYFGTTWQRYAVHRKLFPQYLALSPNEALL